MCQGLVSRHIAHRFCVLASINLYDKPSLETDKVQNAVLEWDLTPKLEL